MVSSSKRLQMKVKQKTKLSKHTHSDKQINNSWPTSPPHLMNSFSFPFTSPFNLSLMTLNSFDYFQKSWADFSLNPKTIIWLLIGKQKQRETKTMAMPWAMTMWMAKMVWVALTGWVSSCLTVADEVANSLRTGDIGPFHVG